jgi:hypothetical protein
MKIDFKFTYWCVFSKDLPSADSVNKVPYGHPMIGSAGKKALPTFTLLHEFDIRRERLDFWSNGAESCVNLIWVFCFAYKYAVKYLRFATESNDRLPVTKNISKNNRIPFLYDLISHC